MIRVTAETSQKKIDEMMRLKLFAEMTNELRREFSEHAREIDRCIYDVKQKLDNCGHAACQCGMTFEQFHAAMNRRRAERKQ